MGGVQSLRTGVLREISLALVMFAIGIMVLIPRGFMPGSDSSAPFAMVICGPGGATIQAALPGVDAQGAPSEHGSGTAHDQPCAFSGHGLGLSAAIQSPVPVAYAFVLDHRSGRLPPSLAPGRGLAAPPPPSQGPPQQV